MNKMRSMLGSAVVVASIVAATARADDFPDGDSAPSEYATAVRNNVGQIVFWECSGKCNTGDVCCRVRPANP